MEIMDKLKVGDVVQLRSGGPEMTVINDDVPGMIKCEWFSALNNSYRFEVFPTESLMKDGTQ